MHGHMNVKNVSGGCCPGFRLDLLEKNYYGSCRVYNV